jgi:predicted kinase
LAPVDLPDRKLEADVSAAEHGVPGNGDLSRRLAALSDAHPASSGYGEARTRLGEPRERRDDFADFAATGAPLTDGEHAEHRIEVATKLADARQARQPTDYLHTVDNAGKIWTRERAAQHDAIIHDLYAAAASVPAEGKAVLAGGLPGAGKTTVLTTLAGVDRARYLTLNPDVVKEEMAARGMLPVIEGLSPMEASELAHEESSYIAKQLALRAYADRKNVIWDMTMSSTRTTQGRITELRSSGYRDIEGIFVDIPVEVSVRRADGRHREGHDDYLAGEGFGGRYISPELIRAQADPDYGSVNRATFENVKATLSRWRCFDNAVDGRAAVLVGESAESDRDGLEEAV